MIIVIAIAMLVLVVIAAFFVSGTKPLDKVAYQNAIANSCGIWRTGATPCKDLSLNVVIGTTTDGTPNSVPIQTACQRAFPEVANPLLRCEQFCGCTS